MQLLICKQRGKLITKSSAHLVRSMLHLYSISGTRFKDLAVYFWKSTCERFECIPEYKDVQIGRTNQTNVIISS